MSYMGFASKEAFDKALDKHITREPTEYPCDECDEIECTDECRCDNCREALAENQQSQEDARD